MEYNFRIAKSSDAPSIQRLYQELVQDDPTIQVFPESIAAHDK